MRKTAILALEDGSYFIGYSFGAEGETGGELIFNTSMTGYREKLTASTNKGQSVVKTQPRLETLGVNEQ